MDKSGIYALSTELGNMDSAQHTHQSQQILSQLTVNARYQTNREVLTASVNNMDFHDDKMSSVIHSPKR